THTHTHTHTHTGILDRQKTKPSSCHVLLFPTHFSNNHYHLSQTGASTACMHMQTHTEDEKHSFSAQNPHCHTHTHTQYLSLSLMHIHTHTQICTDTPPLLLSSPSH